MSEKIVSVNKDLILKKLKDTRERISATTLERGSELGQTLASKASVLRNNVQNQFVDVSLKINEKQGELIKKQGDILRKLKR